MSQIQDRVNRNDFIDISYPIVAQKPEAGTEYVSSVKLEANTLPKGIPIIKKFESQINYICFIIFGFKFKSIAIIVVQKTFIKILCTT